MDRIHIALFTPGYPHVDAVLRAVEALGFGVVSTGRPWNLRAAARADDTVSIDCIRGRW